jgi:hypothetical protein
VRNAEGTDLSGLSPFTPEGTFSLGRRESLRLDSIFSQNSNPGDHNAATMWRSGADRRIAFSIRYWVNGGVERRQRKERREGMERRADWVKFGRWHSVFVGELFSADRD